MGKFRELGNVGYLGGKWESGGKVGGIWGKRGEVGNVREIGEVGIWRVCNLL